MLFKNAERSKSRNTLEGSESEVMASANLSFAVWGEAAIDLTVSVRILKSCPLEPAGERICE